MSQLKPNSKSTINTPESVGNQFGMLCPKCKKGDGLRIEIKVWCHLDPDGTDVNDEMHVWEDDSPVECTSGCGWEGKVSDLVQADNFQNDSD